jgi:hypothetical protein
VLKLFKLGLWDIEEIKVLVDQQIVFSEFWISLVESITSIKDQDYVNSVFDSMFLFEEYTNDAQHRLMTQQEILALT